MKNKKSIVVQKIKEKLRLFKKTLSNLAAQGKTIAARKPAQRISQPKVERKSVSQESEIQSAKYYTGQAAVRREMPQELPFGYNVDRLVLQVRDPWWLHVYWEVTGSTIESYRQRLGGNYNSARMMLRVYDVSQINFDGTNAHRHFDITIQLDARNWYIDVGGPGRSWCVDLGLLLSDGRFITILRSNTVTTPLDGPSWITDEEWMIPDELFARLYGLGVGFGKSSPVGKGWLEKIKKEFISSPGSLSSVTSPAKKALEKGFWLVVNTELIVYGATEPDAHVTVQGRRIQLRPDGTFSLRYALPDGKQVIPVQATSYDQSDTRTITPIVTRETK